MKKRYLTNLILIGLIMGLYWFNSIDKPVINEMSSLSTLDSSHIHNITISRPGSDDIKLERSASGWLITQPINAVANTIRIELLLSFLNTPSYAQFPVNNDSNLGQFELQPAALILTLEQLKVQFGGIEPISKHRYVMIDHVIHLITDRITPLLRANATSFIENKLIPNNNIITKLVLPKLNADNSLSDESVTIENNNGHWQSSLSTLTTDRLTAIVQNWQHAYALQVLPTKKLISEPNNVKIWFKDETVPAEYQLKLNDKAVFVFDPQQQLNYQFTRTLLTQLLPSHTIKQ